MPDHGIDPVRDRVLVLAPGGRDAALLCGSLEVLEVQAVAADGIGALADALRQGSVGAAIIAEECLTSASLPRLIESIRDQPPWSDLPLIVLTRRGGVTASNAQVTDLLGNVTTLERPFHPTTLVGAVRAALRSRGRQRAAEALLAERDAAEAELRSLNEELERRVEERTAEREAVVAQLHEARKLETLGQLTGGVAHDFNNLLTPIMGGLDILSRKLADDPRATRIAAGAMQSAERARTLVARLLAFGRRQRLQAKSIDLAGLVAGMHDLIQRSLGPTIKVEVDLPEDLPAVFVDPQQLEMSLLNLAVNSRDAMNGEGVLTVAARVAQGAEVGLAGQAVVGLSVTDTGHGMDEATLERAVEPFFTTKAVGEGTGLGLSMVHGLAAQSGGAFKIESRVGEGTTATLWLPVAQEPAAALRVTETAEVPRGSGTVLLVDDEELVRTSVAASLREIGFEVVEAASGTEALKLLQDNIRPRVLITDHMMPGMSGATLARRAKATLPSLPVLLVTGYAKLTDEESAGLDVLAKPFRMGDLAGRIAQLGTTERAAVG